MKPSKAIEWLHGEMAVFDKAKDCAILFAKQQDSDLAI